MNAPAPVPVTLALEHDVAAALEQLAARARVSPSALVAKLVRGAAVAAETATLADAIARSMRATDTRGRL